jgi:hypothetical protein
MSKRTKAQKEDHAAKERARYRILKQGLLNGIAMKHGERDPYCMMPTGRMFASLADTLDGEAPSLPIICGDPKATEIDHKHFSRFKQRPTNSVQRLERFAIEFVKRLGGDGSCELRIACRSCNAKHQPKRDQRAKPARKKS